LAKKKKKTSKKAAGGATGGAGARRRGRRPNLTGVTLSELQREVARRASQVDDLIGERDELRARLEELDEQIEMLSSISGGGAAPARRGRPPKQRGRPAGRRGRPPASGRKRATRKRPRNDASLAEAMATLLQGKTMGVTEIASAVQKAGYKTNSENFRTIVNQTLIKDDRFKKVSRGQYTAA
jgi:hypothetical protein